MSGSRDSLVGVGNGTIDIHVQVTINTNSPSSTLTNGGTLPAVPLSPPIPYGFVPGSTLLSPPGTLADLKKHRSLIRTTSNPLSNGTLQQYPNSISCSSTSSSFSQDKYQNLNNVPSSNSSSSSSITQNNQFHNMLLHRAVPFPGHISGFNNSVASYEYEHACCNWDMSEFDSASFAYSGGALISNAQSQCGTFSSKAQDISNYDYLYDDSGGCGFINSHTNQPINKLYITNLTGVLNELPPKTSTNSYGVQPTSQNESLKRYVEPTEIGDYNDEGKKCCCIV